MARLIRIPTRESTVRHFMLAILSVDNSKLEGVTYLVT